MKQLLFEVSAPVSASADQLRTLFDNDWLLENVLLRQGAERTGAAATGRPEQPANGREYVDIDRGPGTFGIQGHWWYRGEWSIAHNDGDVRLVYRVFNIARSNRWAVPLANKMFIGYRNGMQAGIDQLAKIVNQKVSGDAAS